MCPFLIAPFREDCGGGGGGGGGVTFHVQDAAPHISKVLVGSQFTCVKGLIRTTGIGFLFHLIVYRDYN